MPFFSGSLPQQRQGTWSMKRGCRTKSPGAVEWLRHGSTTPIVYCRLPIERREAEFTSDIARSLTVNTVKRFVLKMKKIVFTQHIFLPHL